MGRERKADDAYVEAADFLRELGYDNQAEIARVLDIAMNPNSLFVSSKGSQRSGRTKPRRLSVADDMRPVAAFLIQQGLNHAGLRTVFSGHPPVLGYSVDQRLRPLWEYLSTELALGDISATVAARPSLLGMRPDDMRKVVGWLQTQEYSADDIAKYLATTI